MSDKASVYRAYLKKSRHYDLFTPAQCTITEFPDIDRTFLETTALCTAPTLTAYILWVLRNVIANKIDTLFFLARDGLVMYKIANFFCETWKLPIKCKYLYCSRYSLRIPLYAIDREYATEKMCQYLFNTTLLDVLGRGGIIGDIAEAIANELDMDLNERLSQNDLEELQYKLLNNASFDKLASENAKEALKGVKGYLSQELDASGKYAIVDTGWVGSVHKCISMLRNYEPVTGYYFGMDKSGDPRCGTYYCFLFERDKQYREMGWFCVNLFECLCAADHGMTMGYTHAGEAWRPLLADAEYANADIIWNASVQMTICEQYAKHFAEYNKMGKSDVDKSIIANLLKSLMTRPSYSEARIFGAIPFSPISSVNPYILAHGLNKREIKQNRLTFRLAKAMRGERGKNIAQEPIYWPEGAIALSRVNCIQKIDMKLLPIIYRLVQGRNR
jgi:hypothetical protein